MKILVTGANGQLGYELKQTCPEGWELDTSDVPDLDITDASAVGERMDRVQPRVVVNAAGYTAVDKAESDRELAFAVNAVGPEILARCSAERGVRMIHISTDFVFDGHASVPYMPDAPTNPLSTYGETKLQGELRVRTEAERSSVIIRTAWLYSAHGNNFVKTMLRLMAERPSLGIIADQVGTPTWAKGLARCIWGFVDRSEMWGTFHWTDAGVASWYDFAYAIQEEGLRLGLLDREIPIKPIPTRAYPTPAQRPHFSVLDKSSSWEALRVEPMHWRLALRNMLEELRGL